MDEQKPNFDDYRIPGTDVFNFSAWSRDNVPKPPAKLKVGDTGYIILDAEVQEIYKDVDGTPLYATDQGNGYPDSALVTIEEMATRLKKWAAEDGTPEGLQRLIEFGWDTKD